LQRREAQQRLVRPVCRQAAVCILLPHLCFLLRLGLFGVPPPGVELLRPRPQLADAASQKAKAVTLSGQSAVRQP
jgi:hypothetical protein